MKIFETETQIVKLKKDIQGSILDIGGGGEGVIGRLYKDRVTAIDNRQDELDEAPDGPIKLLMDAEELKFNDNEFDAVTSFFTLMYIPAEDHKAVLMEIYRVLKPEGKLYLWDTIIPENKDDYEVFILNLEIKLPDEQVKTGYGVGYQVQKKEEFIDNLLSVGFKIKIKVSNDQTFYIVAEK